VKKNVIEIKAIGKDYIIVQKNGKGLAKRIVGKIKGRKTKNLLSINGLR
jgi:hypothetical protein